MSISLTAILAGTVGAVLVLAAVGKLRSRAGINVVVRQLLPARLTRWSRQLALVLIMVEFATGLACFIPGLRLSATVLASAMALGFTVLALGTTLGLMNVDCACFGGTRRKLDARDVARDLVLLIMAVAVWTTPASAAISLSGSALVIALVLAALAVAFIAGAGRRRPGTHSRSAATAPPATRSTERLVP
ncbi:MauE/DoxX family redox-associated membrane protein [Propionibacteriaceae bacterium Y1685]